LRDCDRFGLTHARELVGRAVLACSRSDAIQSSGKPEALQNIAAPAPKLGVLALARLRPLWIAHARELAGRAVPTSSRSDAIQSSGKPEALQNIAAPSPKLGVLALARLRPLWIAHARELAGRAVPTSSRSDAIQSSGKPEALQNAAASAPKFGVAALARLRPLWMTQTRELAGRAVPACSCSDAIQSHSKEGAPRSRSVSSVVADPRLTRQVGRPSLRQRRPRNQLHECPRGVGES